MDLTLTAVFEEVPQAEGGGYVAYAEELPGAITQGDTLEEHARTCGMQSKSCLRRTANSPSSRDPAPE